MQFIGTPSRLPRPGWSPPVARHENSTAHSLFIALQIVPSANHNGRRPLFSSVSSVSSASSAVKKFPRCSLMKNLSRLSHIPRFKSFDFGAGKASDEALHYTHTMPSPEFLRLLRLFRLPSFVPEASPDSVYRDALCKI